MTKYDVLEHLGKGGQGDGYKIRRHKDGKVGSTNPADELNLTYLAYARSSP